MRRSQGEEILLERYARAHGRPVDLANPSTFTEKLTCRLVELNRQRRPAFTHLVDKYAVRPYVAERVGEEHLVDLLWHGSEPERLPFDDLPASYVIKANNGSGRTIVVREGTSLLMKTVPFGAPLAVDHDEIITQLSSWLRSNYYWEYREHQYFHIRPLVLVEESLLKSDGSRLYDFKYWCFGGKPELIQVDDNLIWDMHPFYDPDWNQVDLSYRDFQPAPPIPRPGNLEEMNSIAAGLAEGFDFVRVDLYDVDGRVYFGELTFTPTAGEMILRPEHWDVDLGKKWKMTPL
jgi:hypothetical protein